MRELTSQSKNRLLQGEIVTQELSATIANHRRWIAIYPLKNDRIKEKYSGFKFKVIDFELGIKLVDDFFGDEDKKNLSEYLVSSEIELDRLLSELGVDLTAFDVPWKNNYPL